jgi:hypothetical protein
VVNSRKVYNTERPHALLEFVLIMIPFNFLGCKKQEAFFNFLVHLLSLFSQQTFLNDSHRVFGKHVAYLFNYQSLLRFNWDIRLIREVLPKQNVVKESLRFLFGIGIYFVRMILYVLHVELMQSFLLDSVKHYLVDSFSEEGLAESAFHVSRVAFIQNLYVVVGF